MFTGLVEELGSVVDIFEDGPESKTITIACQKVNTDATLGASVSINGCCLTVVKIDGEVLHFQAGSETLSRTNLGELTAGDKVNLERALTASSRLGGHYVSGHIDGLGKVVSRDDEGDWAHFKFQVPQELTRQMASKGSVAVDGVSLTLVDVEIDSFTVALIPHTLEATTIGSRNVGASVNIETDILAKYVEQQLTRQQLTGQQLTRQEG